MASNYYGLNRGQTEFTGDAAGVQGVTESNSSSGTTDIEIRIDQTKNLTQAECYHIITELRDWIVKNRSKYQIG